MHLRARTVRQWQPRAGLVQEQNQSVSRFYFQDGQLESRKKEKPEVEVGKAPAPCKPLLKHLSDQQVKQKKKFNGLVYMRLRESRSSAKARRKL